MEQSKTSYAERGYDWSDDLGQEITHETGYKLFRLFMDAASPGFCGSEVSKDIPNARCFKFEIDVSNPNTPHLFCELVYDEATTGADLGVWYGMGNWTAAHYDTLTSAIKSSKGKITLRDLDDMTQDNLLAPGVWGAFLDNIIAHMPQSACNDIKEKYGEEAFKNFCAEALCRMARAHLRLRPNDDGTTLVKPFLHRISDDNVLVLFSGTGLGVFDASHNLAGERTG